MIIRGKSTEAKNFAYYLKKGEDTISSLKISGDATFEYKNFWNNFKIEGESSQLKNEKTILYRIDNSKRYYVHICSNCSYY